MRTQVDIPDRTPKSSKEKNHENYSRKHFLDNYESRTPKKADRVLKLSSRALGSLLIHGSVKIMSLI
jgi:hypothetical protein